MNNYSDSQLYLIKQFIKQGKFKAAVLAAQDFGKYTRKEAVEFVVRYGERLNKKK
ncbi:MAG: hypothetical protein ACYSUK_00125 [Planctomycetota bacterium]|jgi:hypothetical protein